MLMLQFDVNQSQLAFNAPPVLRNLSTTHEKPDILETTSANS